MSDVAEERPTIPMELIDRLFDQPVDTKPEALGDPEPDELEEETPEDTEDTDEESPEDTEDTETEKEPGEDEEPADKEKGEPDPLTEKLSKEERAAIEADPRLQKAHRQMQAALTRKTQELADQRRAVEARDEVHEQFIATLGTDEGATEFLLGIGLEKFELLEKAYERAAELQDDPEARKQFEKDRALKERERKVEQREQEDAKAARDNRISEITSQYEKFARKAGLTEEEDLVLVDKAIAARIRANASKTGTADITAAEIQAEVEEVAGLINRRVAKTRTATKSEERESRNEATKKKAADAKAPQPPRGSSSAGVKTRKPEAAPEGVDPVAFRISQLLG